MYCQRYLPTSSRLYAEPTLIGLSLIQPHGQFQNEIHGPVAAASMPSSLFALLIRSLQEIGVPRPIQYLLHLLCWEVEGDLHFFLVHLPVYVVLPCMHA